MVGEEARQAGLATVQRHLVTLNALLDTCTAMQHRTSLLLPGIADQHSLETHSLIAESIDGMVEDVQYEDAAEDFSNSPGNPTMPSGTYFPDHYPVLIFSSGHYALGHQKPCLDTEN